MCTGGTGELVLDGLPDAGCEGTAYEGTSPEHPELLKGLAAFEDGGSKATGGVDAGAGVVDANEVDEHEAKTDGEAGEVAGTLLLVGRAEHYEDEEHGQYDFGDETVGNAAGACVGTGLGAQCEFGRGADEGIEDGATDEGSDALENDIHRCVLAADALVEPAAEGDGGVDVAAADAADGIGHRHNGKAEGEGGAYDAGGVNTTIETYGCAATEEHEDGCADHFCKILFHVG